MVAILADNAAAADIVNGQKQVSFAAGCMSRNPATGAMTAGAAQINPASPDTPGLTSSRGRLVKPKVWDDGTEAGPVVGTHVSMCSFQHK